MKTKILIAFLLMAAAFSCTFIPVNNRIVEFLITSIAGTMFFIGMLQMPEGINTIINNRIYKHDMSDALFITFYPAPHPKPGRNLAGRLPNGKLAFSHSSIEGVDEGTWLVKVLDEKSNFAIVVPVRRENQYEKIIRCSGFPPNVAGKTCDK